MALNDDEKATRMAALSIASRVVPGTDWDVEVYGWRVTLYGRFPDGRIGAASTGVLPNDALAAARVIRETAENLNGDWMEGRL